MLKLFCIILTLCSVILMPVAKAQQITDSLQPSNKIEQAKKLQLYRKSFYQKLPKHKGWVNDFDNLFTNSEKKKLDSVISLFEKETSAQICIITLDTLCVATDKFNDLVLRFANGWGVGQKGKNNGVTIGINRGYRKIRITNGYGIEKIFTDLETKKIMENYFIASFKKDEYFKGTYDGVLALIKTLTPKLSKLK